MVPGHHGTEENPPPPPKFLHGQRQEYNCKNSAADSDWLAISGQLFFLKRIKKTPRQVLVLGRGT